MVMHIVMLKNSNTNIQVHGEDWDGGWEIWREKNPKHVRTQHWNLRGCLKTFSPICELATLDLLDKSILSHLWGCFDGITVVIAKINKFIFCTLLKL